jgi:hypothetical protein
MTNALYNLESKIPHKKKLIIPGYGCLSPTFKELSTNKTRSTTMANPRKLDDARIVFRHRYTIHNVYPIPVNNGKSASRPKLYTKSK